MTHRPQLIPHRSTPEHAVREAEVQILASRRWYDILQFKRGQVQGFDSRLPMGPSDSLRPDCRDPRVLSRTGYTVPERTNRRNRFDNHSPGRSSKLASCLKREHFASSDSRSTVQEHLSCQAALLGEGCSCAIVGTFCDTRIV